MGAVHRVWAEDSEHRLCSFPGLESSAKEGKAAANAQVDWPPQITSARPISGLSSRTVPCFSLMTTQ